MERFEFSLFDQPCTLATDEAFDWVVIVFNKPSLVKFFNLSVIQNISSHLPNIDC